jgi:hypothetical protein
MGPLVRDRACGTVLYERNRIYRGVFPSSRIAPEAFVTLERPDIHEPTTTSASAVAAFRLADHPMQRVPLFRPAISSPSSSSLTASSTSAPAARSCACARPQQPNSAPPREPLTSARSCDVCAAVRRAHTRYGESARSGQCGGRVVRTSGASKDGACDARRFAAAVSAAVGVEAGLLARWRWSCEGSCIR